MSRGALLSTVEETLRNPRADGHVAPAQAFVGFDGYVDTMYRVVRQNGSEGTALFETIADFARHLLSAAGQSADTELLRQETRFGGNAPLLSNALARLGMQTVCVGAMGYPELHPVFADLAASCRCLSVCAPGEATAFEFTDGKLMFADLTPLEVMDWTLVKQRVGRETLSSLARDSALIALVNWGGLTKAHGIWEGLLHEFLNAHHDSGSQAHRKRVFVDLADLSKRPTEDVLSLSGLLRGFAARHEVVLGLNEHEARILHQRLGAADPGKTDALEDTAQELRALMGIDAVVIHPLGRSLAATGAGVVVREGKLVARPRLSTGGGDNFNAGYCFGRALGLEEGTCLEMGMTVSGMYVRDGRSPSLADVLAELHSAE